MSNSNDSLSKVVINWYPGHMAKTKKQIINDSWNIVLNIEPDLILVFFMSFIFYIEDMENIESKGCLDNSYLKTLDEDERKFIITLLLNIQTKLINHSYDFDEDERELLMKMVLLKLKDITLPG